MERFREAILEYTEVGAYLKVSAMDPDTLTEVSVVGPISGSKEMLKRTVLAKLDYVLQKNAGESPARGPVMLNTVTYGPTGTLRRIK